MEGYSIVSWGSCTPFLAMPSLASRSFKPMLFYFFLLCFPFHLNPRFNNKCLSNVPSASILEPYATITCFQFIPFVIPSLHSHSRLCTLLIQFFSFVRLLPINELICLSNSIDFSSYYLKEFLANKLGNTTKSFKRPCLY